MGARVGEAAPAFKTTAVLADNTFAEVSLSQFKGKYLLLFFYPLDFTFVCPSEILAFNSAVAEFKNRGVELVGCSIDSHFTHKAWKDTPVEKGGIGQVQFPILSDVTHEIVKAYGVEAAGGMAYRGLFLIDAEGIVRHMLVNDLPLGRSVEEALRVVDALQFTEKYGEVCPANWKKGMKAMKPTADGVAEYLKEQYAGRN
ncbi:peroxiredoxin [Gregarina niphandrodes]|uniref:Peroxiredoxin n=1 Tax=Gregarina niphandrodes TaxID=110365 RepID=A0A023B2Y3_GRENI|nr:peroxiredoxin [Gregarina niphandrodes]EZG55199.1 peroxiredoxin [Gregarina niphandrodes]|eukprot:XP_011131726.1 peroxiredoxin [Gregarina niphandrodes]